MRLAILLCLGLMFGADADARRKKDGEGVPIRVTVLDQSRKAVPTAVIRHPDEADRHRVNSLTGTWEASVLYLPDGSELVFTPGMTIQFEVSAPGFLTKVIQYDIRKRRNFLEIQLEPMEVDNSDIDEPIIQFGRDKPRDVGGVGPAN